MSKHITLLIVIFLIFVSFLITLICVSGDTETTWSYGDKNTWTKTTYNSITGTTTVTYHHDPCLSYENYKAGYIHTAQYTEGIPVETAYAKYINDSQCEISTKITLPTENKCKNVNTTICKRKNQTEYYNITYIFDGNYNLTKKENYTRAIETCQDVEISYIGAECSVINETKTLKEFIKTQEAKRSDGIVNISCEVCPISCEKKQPIESKCGDCVCPSNYGFCDRTGLRENINGTAVYCSGDLKLRQKADNETCLNGYECENNGCSEEKCYNPSIPVKENTAFLPKILKWLTGLFKR